MTTNSNDFFALLEEMEEDRDVRTAALENSIRRNIASTLDEHRKAKGLSLRELAKEMGTSLSQVQRILHREQGGNLTLRTLVRAVDTLGLKLTINVRPTPAKDAKIHDLGAIWPSSSHTSP